MALAFSCVNSMSLCIVLSVASVKSDISNDRGLSYPNAVATGSLCRRVLNNKQLKNFKSESDPNVNCPFTHTRWQDQMDTQTSYRCPHRLSLFENKVVKNGFGSFIGQSVPSTDICVLTNGFAGPLTSLEREIYVIFFMETLGKKNKKILT